MRRWLLGAGVLSLAALVFSSGFGSAGDEPAGEPDEPVAIAQPIESPLDHPVANYLPKGWQDLQEPVVVQFSAITKDGKQLVSDVRMTNRGEATLKGPVRIVIDEMGIEGLSLKNASGKLGNGDPYVELLTKARTLKAGKTTAPRKLTIAAQAEPATEKLAAFDPKYRVLVPADPARPQDHDTATEFTQEELNRTMAIQNALDAQLRKGGSKDIFGTGTSIDEQGKLYISVFARIANPDNVPKQMDGIPVKVELKGPFFAQYEDLRAELLDGRFARPVSLGVGIGNETGCGLVGTLGGRAQWRGQTCLLSNYHVLVGHTKRVVAHRIMQPAGCENVKESNSLGRVTGYVPITFSTNASNRYDAAWAGTTSSLVAAGGFGGGKLGAPRAPALGLRVMKIGRTTEFTAGQITSVNVNLTVSYGAAGSARFIGCFHVTPTSHYPRWSAGGDSGSLVITLDTNQPVGMHFAGSGRIGTAFPIPGLLSAAGMTMDLTDPRTGHIPPPGKR